MRLPSAGDGELVERDFDGSACAALCRVRLIRCEEIFGSAQGAGGAQNHQVMKRVMQLAFASDGMDVARACQGTNRGGRQSE